MSSQTITRKYLDYNNEFDSTEDRAYARKLTQRGKAADLKISQGIWQYGEVLAEGRELMPHGTFMRWIDVEFGLSYDVARRLINVFERVKVCDLANFGLTKSVLFILTETNVADEVLEIGLEMAASGDLKTTKDAKQLIEAAKPIQIPKFSEFEKPEDDDLGPDPFAEGDSDQAMFLQQDMEEDEPGESLADIAAIDAEEDEPVVDVPEQEGNYFTDETPAPEPKPDTLKQRVKSAEVVHDTLKSAAPKAEEDMNTQELFESLPINRVLREKGHKGIFLQRDLRGYYSIMEAKKTFDHHARRAYDTKNADSTMFARALTGWVSLPHPRDWQVCAPCKGNGCQRCGFAGYDTSGAGISPLRVESGEVTL